VDAQGQIWAAGNQGIDIFSLQGDSSGRPKFVRARPQPITQNDGLPDNNIRDLALDSATGKALIASASGLSLWTSPYRSVPSRLTKSIIKVYPNPVRLRQNRTLFVDGATSGAQFDLVAADGTLILHQDRDKSNYGAFQINLPTTSKVRPGVYYWSLKDSRNSVHGPLLIGE
jgi:ligand-binding sensor domain-containing protein